MSLSGNVDSRYKLACDLVSFFTVLSMAYIIHAEYSSAGSELELKLDL